MESQPPQPPARSRIIRKLWQYALFLLLIAISFIITPFKFSLLGEGKIRSQFSSAKANARVIALALESYRSDNGSYPAMQPIGNLVKDQKLLSKQGGLALTTFQLGLRGPSFVYGLTTPIAYLPVAPQGSSISPSYDSATKLLFEPVAYWRTASNDEGAAGWIIWFPGPDQRYDIQNPESFFDPAGKVDIGALAALSYDPTNGVRSTGDGWQVNDGARRSD